MKNNASLAEIGSILAAAQSVLVFPHVNPDGDALGSSIALCLSLRKAGKEAWVLVGEEIPRYIDFLDVSCCTRDTGCIAEPDVCICVDCSEENRLPGRIGAYGKGRTKLCIDHHATGCGFGDMYYIDSGEAAAAQIVYRLLMTMNGEISSTEAMHLYVGIVTDTGCFQYSNTTSQTHEIVAGLFKAGIPHMDIMIRLYQNVSRSRVETENEIIRSMQFFAEGKIAMAYVTKKMLESFSASSDDTEGVIDILRNIEGVELAAFLKEKDGKVKASLRAKSYGNVGDIAVKFGGGGHVKAAGFTVDAPLLQTFEALKHEMLMSLENGQNETREL